MRKTRLPVFAFILLTFAGAQSIIELQDEFTADNSAAHRVN